MIQCILWKEETLKSFGIEAKVGEVNSGPTITSFEVHPSIGVKVQKIKALENDIALNMLQIDMIYIKYTHWLSA